MFKIAFSWLFDINKSAYSSAGLMKNLRLLGSIWVGGSYFRSILIFRYGNFDISASIFSILVFRDRFSSHFGGNHYVKLRN